MREGALVWAGEKVELLCIVLETISELWLGLISIPGEELITVTGGLLACIEIVREGALVWAGEKVKLLAREACELVGAGVETRSEENS